MHQIFCGDAVSVLRSFPEESVSCCITSPPYYGLRDYGVSGQIGLEETPEEYISKLVSVFRHVKRVLREDGTLWLNIADSYAGSGKGRYADGSHPEGAKQATNTGAVAGALRKTDGGCKNKDLIGIPWMLAFALRADGCYLRQEIIWAKPNPMPESVTDRCTKSHESIFLLSKSPRYFFDAEAIAEPVADSTKARLAQNVADQTGSDRVPGKTNGNMKAVGQPEKRNKRDVWWITTKPFKGAHFATFPMDLVEPCLTAGCPAGRTVLDPFGGSGSVGEVAEKNGRNSILIDLNPDYCEMMHARLDVLGGCL